MKGLMLVVLCTQSFQMERKVLRAIARRQLGHGREGGFPARIADSHSIQGSLAKH